MLPCASRDAGLQPDVAKHIVMAAWMLHGLCFGRKPGQETLCFFGYKVAPAGDERYLVCAAGAAALEPMRNRFLHCVLQRVVVHVCDSSLRFLTFWLQIAV